MPTYSAKVRADGAVTLPPELCEKLGIVAGADVEFFLTVDGQVHFHAVTGNLNAFGVRAPRPPISVREMDDAISDGVVERNERSKSRSRSRPAAE